MQDFALQLCLLDEDGSFERGREQIRSGMIQPEVGPGQRANLARSVKHRVPDADAVVVEELTDDNVDDEGVTLLMPEDFSGADAMEVLAQIGNTMDLYGEDFDG